MITLLQSMDSTVFLTVFAPLILAIGAWALRMACSLCAVDTPNFWHAVLTFIILIVANVAWRFFMHVTRTPETMGTQYLAPALTNAAVIAVSLPTGPIAASMISVVHILISAAFALAAANVVDLFVA